MWAQDTTAMYGYAGASAAASQMMTPFTEPGQVTNPAELTQLMSTLPATLQALASPLQSGSSSAAGTLSSLLNPANLGSMASSGGSNLVGVLSNLLGIFGSGDATPAPASGRDLSSITPTPAGAAGPAGRAGGIGAGLPAGMGGPARSACSRCRRPGLPTRRLAPPHRRCRV